MIKFVIYQTSSGKEPYSEWEDNLDYSILDKVRSRIARVRLGNFGDAKMLKGANGVWELRIDCGPGYRIYFGKIGQTIVILLTGGDKKSQKSDVEKAKRYWLDYKDKI